MFHTVIMPLLMEGRNIAARDYLMKELRCSAPDAEEAIIVFKERHMYNHEAL